MTLLEIAIHEMLGEFKNYPVLQEAWSAMNEAEQEKAFNNFVSAVCGVLNGEAFSND